VIDRGPWFITPEDAAKREAKLLADFETDVRRHIPTDTPDDIAIAKLFDLGYRGRLLRTLQRLIDARNNQERTDERQRTDGQGISPRR
jgi:hypothetical protein